jgi:hypothetical protein
MNNCIMIHAPTEYSVFIVLVFVPVYIQGQLVHPTLVYSNH